MGLFAAQFFYSIMQDVMQDDEHIDKPRRWGCVILYMYSVSLGNWPRYNRACVLLVEVGVDSREKVDTGFAVQGLVSGAEAARQCFEQCCSWSATVLLGIASQPRCSRPLPLTTTPSNFHHVSATFSCFARAERVQNAGSRVKSPTLPAACDCDRSRCNYSGGEEGAGGQSFQTPDAYCIVHIVDFGRGIGSMTAPPRRRNLVYAKFIVDYEDLKKTELRSNCRGAIVP